MLLLTLRGTPTLYYGDELGLEDVTIPSSRIQDPWAKNEPGLGFGRDPQRTPMPWNSSSNADFSHATPWLPLNADYTTRNVSALQADPRSILYLYRRMIAVRRDNPALSIGRFISRGVSNDVYVFERSKGNARVMVALNFANDSRPIPFSPYLPTARVMLSTCLDRSDMIVGTGLRLRPMEGVILELPPLTSASEKDSL
jgi:alpha-glucosidase